eukprot:1160705-Pelagomonas_calceolata.AAC.2
MQCHTGSSAVSRSLAPALQCSLTPPDQQGRRQQHQARCAVCINQGSIPCVFATFQTTLLQAPTQLLALPHLLALTKVRLLPPLLALPHLLGLFKPLAPGPAPHVCTSVDT